MKNSENENQNIETLNIKTEPVSEDIPTTFFKPIEEIQDQQETLIKNYEKDNQINEPQMPDLNNEIRNLEHQLNKKKLAIPFLYVLLLIVFINLVWFLGVKFVIVPKYEEYVKQNTEIKQNYESLKKKVDAIIGE